MDETLNEINETIETTNPQAEEIQDIDIPQEEEEIVEPKDWSEWDEHEFTEGETFTGEYPPQAAIWCNENGTHHIEEIEPDTEGNKRFKIVKNPEPTAEEIAQRKAMLNLTAADVERAIYKAKGIDFDDVIRLVEAQPLSEDDKPAIDLKALKIELKANNFYRGSEWVNKIGNLLGFTSEQLDEFFETNDYTKLM